MCNEQAQLKQKQKSLTEKMLNKTQFLRIKTITQFQHTYNRMGMKVVYHLWVNSVQSYDIATDCQTYIFK